MLRNKFIRTLILLIAALAVSAGTAFAASEQGNSPRGDALELVSALGLMQGYEDGSLAPEKTVSRAEAAVLISRALWGGEDDGDLYLDGNPGGFTDIEGHWAAGYINYCTRLGIFVGDGSGLARPNDPIYTVEFCKMALTALGYSPNIESYTGLGWTSNVLADAEAAGLLKNVDAAPFEVSTRADAAQMLYNLIYANIVVYDHSTATFIPAGAAVSGSLGNELPRTFGMEYLGFRTVTGVLYADGYALLDGAPNSYSLTDFSPAPNGVTTVGGLMRSDSGEWLELDRISPPLDLVGRAVTAEFAGDMALSVSASGRNVELTGSPGMNIPEGCKVYVNYALSSDAGGDLKGAYLDGDKVTVLSNDGNSEPEYIFIERYSPVGLLESTGSFNYPDYGVECRFSEGTPRYSGYMIGSFSVGMQTDIMQVGRYSFVRKAERNEPPAVQIQPAQPIVDRSESGIALVTGVFCSSGGEETVLEVYALLETGEKGLYRVETVSIDGTASAPDELAGRMSEYRLACAAVGTQIVRGVTNSTGYTASGLSCLVGYTLSEDGTVEISPTFDGSGVSGESQLTIYSDYTTGDVSLGLGEDGRIRYVADDTVVFLEGENGWAAYRGADIPSLIKGEGLRLVDAAYSNMFSVDSDDSLRLRAAVIPIGEMELDMRGEYEFYMVLDVPLLHSQGPATPSYDFRIFDGREVSYVSAASAPAQYEIFHYRGERGGLVTLYGDSYASGARRDGVLSSCYSGILTLRNKENEYNADNEDSYAVYTCGNSTRCYIIDGDDSRVLDIDDIQDYFGCDVTVIGTDGGSANLIFIYEK